MFLLGTLKASFLHRITCKPTHCFWSLGGWVCPHPPPCVPHNAEPHTGHSSILSPWWVWSFCWKLSSLAHPRPGGGSAFPSESSGCALSFTPKAPHSLPFRGSLNPLAILPLFNTHSSMPVLHQPESATEWETSSTSFTTCSLRYLSHPGTLTDAQEVPRQCSLSSDFELMTYPSKPHDLIRGL